VQTKQLLMHYAAALKQGSLFLVVFVPLPYNQSTMFACVPSYAVSEVTLLKVRYQPRRVCFLRYRKRCILWLLLYVSDNV